jgi:outer membrane lipoprotein-sorting protein
MLIRFLRTCPTRRLLTLLAGVLAAGVATTAIALAATGAGPVPKRVSLAVAVHRALGAKAPAGISATVTYTNNLISTNDIAGSDPLLTGASGRLWVTGDRLRLELQSNNGDAQLVVDGHSFWIYDPTSGTVYRGTIPAWHSRSSRWARRSAGGVPSLAEIEHAITRLAAHLSGLEAIPTDVAGRPAYEVRVSPKGNGGLLSSVELAWDAIRGVPLDFALYAKGDPSPVIQLAVSGISYGRVPLSDFRINPPQGSRVVTIPTSSGRSYRRTRRPRVRMLTFGRGLGAVHVLEEPATRTRATLPAGSGAASNTESGQLTLPTETIRGARVTELATELGTVLEFTRGNERYLVFGSVTLARANAVARSL